ncbi:Rrf2 family transcriptional regulator [Spirosoma sp. KNUC1025]|uniref:Rrf2 family transcriptional regulator n=1 Tax=Spirosoma sp. KNUC1025 TaxID=2894082 RepID=UPI001E44346C|nr:Rrf2 family transcriptional regulator [Spirosoma sp. KNUC1025]UFH57927.1 Rrf2 family transcriptional regulator [Spirosoma sp. KNUC1025]
MSGNFLTAIHIMTYLAYPGNSGASGDHIVSFVNYAENGLKRVTSDEIAGVLNTNPVIIRRLLGQLKEADLVISIRGKVGGYQLAKSATAISLLDVFLAVEGDRVDFFALAHRDNRPGCSPIANSIQQTLHPIFAQSLAALKNDLAHYSIDGVLSTSLGRLETDQTQ